MRIRSLAIAFLVYFLIPSVCYCDFWDFFSKSSKSEEEASTSVKSILPWRHDENNVTRIQCVNYAKSSRKVTLEFMPENKKKVLVEKTFGGKSTNVFDVAEIKGGARTWK